MVLDAEPDTWQFVSSNKHDRPSAASQSSRKQTRLNVQTFIHSKGPVHTMCNNLWAFCICPASSKTYAQLLFRWLGTQQKCHVLLVSFDDETGTPKWTGASPCTQRQEHWCWWGGGLFCRKTYSSFHCCGHFEFKLKIHCESKKQGITILSITSPNVDRFSNFFHWQIH